MSTTIQDAIKRGEQHLKAAEIENPRLAIELMLRKILGLSKVELHLRELSQLEPGDVERLEVMIARKLKREPLQYILGETEWFGLVIKCDMRSLVPRPETEIIVESALERIKGVRNPLVADIGTGSGCIAIAVASERVDASVIACDNSFGALELARENLRVHGLEDRVRLAGADLARFMKGGEEFDLVISNPPYIRESEYPTLMPEVREYEPEGALVAGEDGLDVVRQIVELAPQSLKDKGWIALEFGIDHALPVRKLMVEMGRYDNIRIVIDYNGSERGIIAQLK